MDIKLLSTLSFHQACTGIDDLGIAIMHLEEADWVLVVRKTYFTRTFHDERMFKSVCYILIFVFVRTQ